MLRRAVREYSHGLANVPQAPWTAVAWVSAGGGRPSRQCRLAKSVPGAALLFDPLQMFFFFLLHVQRWTFTLHTFTTHFLH